jgi:hypothetical protein
MYLYYGALHLIFNRTYSFYKYFGALHLKKSHRVAKIFVENACRVILGGAACPHAGGSTEILKSYEFFSRPYINNRP